MARTNSNMVPLGTEAKDFKLDLLGFNEDQLNDMLFEEKQGLTDEDEVPEIKDRIVEIMAVAREAGQRTKIAVRTHRAGVSAKGSLIGPMGSRSQAVANELHGEKIDIIKWTEDLPTLISEEIKIGFLFRFKLIIFVILHCSVTN